LYRSKFERALRLADHILQAVEIHLFGRDYCRGGRTLGSDAAPRVAVVSDHTTLSLKRMKTVLRAKYL